MLSLTVLVKLLQIKSGIPIKPTTHMAAQADGQSMLCTVGETHTVHSSCGAHIFNFDALIIRDLGSDIIVAEPFLEKHDIGVRSAHKQIIIKGCDVISYAQHGIWVGKRAKWFGGQVSIVENAGFRACPKK